MSLLFKDSTGNEWSLKLSLTTIDRVKDATDLDLLGPTRGDNKTYEMIMRDLRILANVVWYIIKPQADAVKFTIEQFRDALDGDTAEQMAEALTESITDFSPRRLRPVMQDGFDAGKESQDAMAKGARQAIAKAKENLKTITDQAETTTANAIKLGIEQALNPSGKSSTNSPA